MAKFMLIYRSTEEARTQLSAEQMQRAAAMWKLWIQTGQRDGWLVDRGSSLTGEGKRISATREVADGPVVETDESVGGYAIIEAADLDAAAELAKETPILVQGGNVEVRPLWGQ